MTEEQAHGIWLSGGLGVGETVRPDKKAVAIWIGPLRAPDAAKATLKKCFLSRR
jgi:hypothetical protein